MGLVLDCADPTALAQFWAAALDSAIVGEAGAYVALVPNERPGPKLMLQRVQEAKLVKSRMHLDIETPDMKPKPSDSKCTARPECIPRPSVSTAPRGYSWQTPKAMSSACATAAQSDTDAACHE